MAAPATTRRTQTTKPSRSNPQNASPLSGSMGVQRSSRRQRSDGNVGKIFRCDRLWTMIGISLIGSIMLIVTSLVVVTNITSDPSLSSSTMHWDLAHLTTLEQDTMTAKTTTTTTATSNCGSYSSSKNNKLIEEHVFMPCLSSPFNSSQCPVVSLVPNQTRLAKWLQRRRIPPKTESNRTAGLCLFIKNEHLYLNEYVDYHLALGFDQILIYDNSFNFNLQPWSQSKRNQTNGRIRIRHWPGLNQQIPAYRQCVETCRKLNHTWAGIMDTDEMLILHEHDHVVDLLEEYCTTGALSLYWKVFGHSNQTRYQPIPLSKRFQYRTETPNQHYKTIGKINDIVDVGVHHIKVRKPTTQHDVMGKNLKGQFGTGVKDRINASQVASIYHYWLKSWEEWFIKACWRGRPINGTGISKQNYNCQHSMSETMNLGRDIWDNQAWLALQHYVPEYAVAVNAATATVASSNESSS